MNEETFNRTKRMFLKRLADNFWYDGQWKFSYTLKKNHQLAREQRSRVTQALRRCVTSEIFPTVNILKMLIDYFTAEELAGIAEARIVQEERLREEKRQHMKILGTVRSAKRQRLTNLMIEPKTEVTLPNGNRAEFISKTEGGNFIFKEIKDHSTHLLTEQEARWILEGKKMKMFECDFCDSQVLGREHWIIQGEKFKFCSRRCAENRAKMTGKKWKLVHIR